LWAVGAAERREEVQKLSNLFFLIYVNNKKVIPKSLSPE
jgi:hypothetical protein